VARPICQWKPQVEVDLPDVPEVTIPHLPFIFSISRSKSNAPGSAIAWHQKNKFMGDHFITISSWNICFPSSNIFPIGFLWTMFQ
jgi:hypothetical protein